MKINRSTVFSDHRLPARGILPAVLDMVANRWKLEQSCIFPERRSFTLLGRFCNASLAAPGVNLHTDFNGRGRLRSRDHAANTFET